MAHIQADRVRETSSTTSTTDFVLSGAVTNFRAFSSVMANGDTCWYAAVLENGGWEVGLGTWVTGGTLQRTTVLASSNSGSKVSFGAGSKDIFLTSPASVLDALSKKTREINAQTGTTYTFVLSDAGNIVTFSNASAQTVTVPPNSSVALPVGTQIEVASLGAGKVTLAQGVGVTINSVSSNKALSAQYAGGTLIKTATDTWLLVGSLQA